MGKNAPALLAAAISNNGHSVETWRDHEPNLSHRTDDKDWIPFIAKLNERRIVITKNIEMLRLPQEIQVLCRSKLTFFFLGNRFSRLSPQELANKIVAAWPEIERRALDETPSIYELSFSTLKCRLIDETSKIRAGRHNVRND
ncbi:MAG: hypothetical protein IT462_10390 [Planctomycetes bacterium]|nr:hypothetical protein [Planctomycetota bacterium]